MGHLKSQAPVTCVLASTALDREAYAALLQTQFELAVQLQCSFEPVSIWAAMRGNPDLALVFYDRPAADIRDGIEMIPRLRAATRVIVVSGSMDPNVIESWFGCPIAAFVYKDGSLEELRAAIGAVLRGGTHYSAGTRELLCGSSRRSNGQLRLSRRESELLPLLARGLTLREAATNMAISYKTADAYRTSLMRKLGVRDRVGLARYAIRAGIVDP